MVAVKLCESSSLRRMYQGCEIFVYRGDSGLLTERSVFEGFLRKAVDARRMGGLVQNRYRYEDRER